MVLVGEFVGGAALGAAFGVLFDVVNEAADRPTALKSLLENIKFSIDFLKPMIEKIGEHNVALGIPDEEIKHLIEEMEEGAKLIRKSSRVSKWNCMKFHYTDQLVEVDGSLKRLIKLLKVQGVRDAKETLILVRESHDQLIETARDTKETWLLVQNHAIELIESAKDGKETLELARQNNDRLVESAKDGKETLDLAKKNDDQLLESVRDGKETLDLAKQNNDRLVESAKDGKETLVVAKKMTRLLKRIENLMPYTCEEKFRHHSGKRSASKRGITAGRSRRIEKPPSVKEIVVEEFLDAYKNLMPFRYSYWNIKKMTNDFEEKLGPGGSGSVYKGELSSGRLVAVKLQSSSKDCEQDFISEVGTIGRINHVNVVRLIGFCSVGSKRALVYDFMPNGSLDKYIFSEKNLLLSWDIMHEIVLGVARGLEYLHQGCDMQILHFDIKPHNILLDENFKSKISGFKLARLIDPRDATVYVDEVRGRPRYVAPEMLIDLGGVSYKTDVYSFGMVLLEIARRRQHSDARAEYLSQIYFPSWIYEQLEKGLSIKIEGACVNDEKIAKKMIMIALWCIQEMPADRPSMTKVLQMLEGENEALQMPPKPLHCPQLRPTENSPSYEIDESDIEELSR